MYNLRQCWEITLQTQNFGFKETSKNALALKGLKADFHLTMWPIYEKKLNLLSGKDLKNFSNDRQFFGVFIVSKIQVYSFRLFSPLSLIEKICRGERKGDSFVLLIHVCSLPSFKNHMLTYKVICFAYVSFISKFVSLHVP